MPQQETIRSCLTTDEINAVIQEFTDADWVRLHKISVHFARICPLEANDLLQESLTRALVGQRNCPRDVDVIGFLAQTMRSICSDSCKEKTRKKEFTYDPYACEVNKASDSVCGELSIDNQQEKEEEYLRIKTSVLSIFEDDEVAQILVEGIMEDMKGEELRSLTNLNKTAFESKRRMIRRRIDKAFPEGWKS